MYTATSNGRPQRKQLADQLDRLDSILDGLSEALNEAVADASREGTRLAVRDAVLELLTDPMLRDKLHQASAIKPSKPSLWSRVKSFARKVWNRAIYLVTQVISPPVKVIHNTFTKVLFFRELLRSLSSLRTMLLVGTGTGLSLASLSFFLPQPIAAAISGIAAGTTAIGVYLAFGVRRLMAKLSIG